MNERVAAELSTEAKEWLDTADDTPSPETLVDEFLIDDRDPIPEYFDSKDAGPGFIKSSGAINPSIFISHEMTINMPNIDANLPTDRLVLRVERNSGDDKITMGLSNNFHPTSTHHKTFLQFQLDSIGAEELLEFLSRYDIEVSNRRHRN